jgi:hypothetical protein
MASALDPALNDLIRRFEQTARAELEQLIAAAFSDELDDLDEESRDAIWQTSAHERRKLFLYYLPWITRRGAELRALLADLRARLLEAERTGRTVDAAAYRAQIARVLDQLERQIGRVTEGLRWAAAELAAAERARHEGRQVWWHLDPAAKHCSVCPEIAAGSPYPSVEAIGGVPGSGLSPCGANCRCYLTFD